MKEMAAQEHLRPSDLAGGSPAEVVQGGREDRDLESASDRHRVPLSGGKFPPCVRWRSATPQESNNTSAAFWNCLRRSLTGVSFSLLLSVSYRVSPQLQRIR